MERAQDGGWPPPPGSGGEEEGPSQCWGKETLFAWVTRADSPATTEMVSVHVGELSLPKLAG